MTLRSETKRRPGAARRRQSGSRIVAARQRRAQAGQSLIIAIAVLFLLAFLSALFITLLARNLERTARSSDVLTADFYAQAGIRYADQMLTTSPQGADWRPPVKYYLGDAYAKLNPDPNTTTVAAGTTFAYDTTATIALTAPEQGAYLAYVNSNATPLVKINAHDPDAFWLAQGFSRYAAQGGRYLIRLTYGNNANDPYEQDNPVTGKFIRIESVGRTGVVDDTNTADPTVYTTQTTRLAATLVAYKPIGLTDYARFITNRDQRSDTFSLGVPSTYNDTGSTTTSSIVTPGVNDFTSVNGTYIPSPFPLVTTYGATTPGTAGANATAQGGSLRCNGNLRLYGMNVAFMNNATGDDWEIAGNLTFDGYQGKSTDPTALQVVENSLPGNTNQTYAASPSNASTYSTTNGFIRDGSSNTDTFGYAGDIKRLNPPAIDSPAPGSGLEHYAALTDQGTILSSTEGGPYVPESVTGPATVYIDNTSDQQTESSSAQAGATLRDDWLNPGANQSGYWHGPFYDPPGATIVFGPQYINTSSGTLASWGFTVTRSDAPVGLLNQSHVTWRWNGSSSLTTPLTASTCTFVYGTQPTGFAYDPNNPVFFIGANQDPQTVTSAGNVTSKQAQNVDNDIVIYAEGNVRVRGTVSPTGSNTGSADAPTITDPVAAANGSTAAEAAPPHHVTLVTNQIAYIEGSLLKGGAFSTTTANNPSLTSSIAVLARRYVTLNTTQFLAGAVQHTSLGQLQVDAAPGGTGTTGALDFDADSSLTESFDEPASTTAPTTALPTGATFAPAAYYVSQYSSGSTNSVGLLNVVETAFDGSSYVGPESIEGVDTANTAPTLNGSASTPNRIIIPISGINYTGTPPNGYDHFDLTFSKSPSSVEDYQLAKAAILPSDMTIQAVLYAQDNSFFVIPGDWFNDDASDTLNAYVTNNDQRSRPAPSNTQTGGVTDPSFPMYGQPIDMKITIDGSVSENVPADVSDQAAWMLRWGWIPEYHGAPGAGGVTYASPHPRISQYALEGQTGALNALPSSVATNIPPSGLTFVYDSNETQPGSYGRVDQYGRPLPFTPNLPVSPDLLYSGQASGNSLVQ